MVNVGMACTMRNSLAARAAPCGMRRELPSYLQILLDGHLVDETHMVACGVEKFVELGVAATRWRSAGALLKL